MYRGISSERFVAAMARAGVLSIFGSAGFSADELEPRVRNLQSLLEPDQPRGMCLIHNLNDPAEELRHAELFLKYDIPVIEASAYASATAPLVYCRVKGLRRGGDGILFPRRIIAKCSRLETARMFLAPPPAEVVAELLESGRIDAGEAELARRIPLADDIAVEADSGGHTDRGVAFSLFPAVASMKEEAMARRAYPETIHVGLGGGVGTPRAAASAFMLGADFIFTGSINQCTAESGAHPSVKDLLNDLDIHDTGVAPAGDMFEIGARARVAAKGTRFLQRARELHRLFHQHDSLEAIPDSIRRKIETRYFKRSVSEVWRLVRDYKGRTDPHWAAEAEAHPRMKMTAVFKWWFHHCNEAALSGDESERDNYLVFCGPAMGAFNGWVRGTALEHWKQRHVADIADRLMRGARDILGEGRDSLIENSLNRENGKDRDGDRATNQTRIPTEFQSLAPLPCAAPFPNSKFETKTDLQISGPGRETPNSRDQGLGRSGAPPVKRPTLPDMTGAAVAVVGMAGRFPKAGDLPAFWDNIAAGRDCISEIPGIDRFYDPDPDAPGKTHCRWMGILEEVDKFDPLFFNISPLEAELMDPQQRLFLESCWSCIEDAGLDPAALSGSRCGVYVGCGPGDYGQFAGDQGLSSHGLIGGSASILSARISYLLNLKGPCLAIETACSSSLVAIAEACDGLMLHTSDLALAGGVHAMVGPGMHIMTSKAGMLSPNGRCFTFDNRADGFVFGNGVGVLLLKRLSDALRDRDPVHGVIRGWGVNQDGRTNGMTAPSVKSQIMLEKEVHERFGIDPKTISLVEAHGTGTRLGDPIEVEALTASFGSNGEGRGPCALGSVKSNIGHLLTAAGVSGMIKTLLALDRRMLPPTIHFETLNEHISLANSPFYVNTELRPWESAPGVPRRACVSAFGFSGTNAHIVIEEAPPDRGAAGRPAPVDEGRPGLFLLSAKSEERLVAHAASMRRHIDAHEALNLSDMAHTLRVGREAMAHRLAFLFDSRASLLAALDRFLRGESSRALFRGRAAPDRDQGDRAEAAPPAGSGREALERAARSWVEGREVDWRPLGDARGSDGRPPRRIGLPAYPFARESYWVPSSSPPDEAPLDDEALLRLFDDVLDDAIDIESAAREIREMGGR